MTARPQKMSNDDRHAMMASLESWALVQEGKAIQKEFRFTNFNAAMGFMMRAGLKAEQLDHHPEWFNVYNRVEVTLTTHDAQGLTILDKQLAEAMDKIAASSGLKVEK